MRPRGSGSDWERMTSVEKGEHFEGKAKHILSSIGFEDIKDGPTLAPYDLTATKGGKTFHIEVRGNQSEKLGVSYAIPAKKIAALSALDNVLFLFVAGKDADRWRLVEFGELKELRTRVKLYSGNFRLGIGATGRSDVPVHQPMGRPRTLLGTRQIPLRIVRRLIDLLDEQAEEEGLSRNVLATRLLAEAVRNHLAHSESKKT